MRNYLKKLSSFNDGFHKSLLTLDPDGICYLSSIISLITGISVFKIASVDRVLDPKSDGAKYGATDGLVFVNDQYVINIEIQHYLDKNKLSDKLQKYLGAMFDSSVNEGRDDGEMYKVIQIVFYEGKVTKTPKKNEDIELVIRHTFQDAKKRSEIVSKMECYIVQIGLINAIYRRKSIESLNVLEGICFFMKNYKKKYSKEIEYITKKYWEVEYMIKGYEKYKNDPAGYLKALREDLRTKYAIAQAKDDGKRIGMKEGKKEGMKEGIREGKEKTLLDSINNLMETMNLTAKQAMDALKIPPNEQSKYQHMI